MTTLTVKFSCATYQTTITWCSELNSRIDKSELNTRNLANLTTVFWCELNSRIRNTNLTPVFLYLKKRWGELNSRILAMLHSLSYIYSIIFSNIQYT